MKYKLVAKPASVRSIPKRSIKIFGAVVLVPTSIPTWQITPINDNNTNGLANKAMVSIKPETLLERSFSIGVAPNHTTARIATNI